MYLRDIKRLLRGGFHPGVHPHKFHNPNVLGEGSFRRAYRVGDYVVKQASHAAQLSFRVQRWNSQYGIQTGDYKAINLNTHMRPTVPYKQIRRNGLELPQQWFVYSRQTGWWQVQIYYPPYDGQLVKSPKWLAIKSAGWKEVQRHEQWRTPKNPLPDHPVYLDLHEGNLGVNEHNKLVAFDW